MSQLQQLLELALNHRATQPGDTAYYIHTSGSTGKPNGVVHVHSSLDWHSHVTLLGSGLTRADDVCLQVADCSFDLHIRDIFCFISTGGHIVTIPPAALTDMLLLCDLFRRYRLVCQPSSSAHVPFCVILRPIHPQHHVARVRPPHLFRLR